MEQKTPHDQHHNKKSLIEKADTANQESLRHSREVPNVTTQVQNILAPSSTSHLMTNLFPTSTDQQTLLSWFSSTTYPIPMYSSFEGIGFNYNNNNNNNNIDMINHNNELEVSKGSSMRKSASQGFQGTSTTGLTFDSDSNKPLSFTGSFMDRYNNHSASDNESALNLSGPITASTSPAMKTISGPTPGNSISPASRSYSSVLHSQAPSHSSTQSIPAAPSQHTIQHGMLHPYQSGISTTASQHLNTSVFKSDFLAQGNRQAIQHQQNFKHVNDFLSPLAQRSYNQHLVQNYSAQLSAASPSGTSSLSGISGSATGSPFRRNFFSGSNFPDKSSTLQGNGGPKRRNKLPSIGTSGGVPGDLQRRLDTLANAGAENSERFSRKVFVGGLPPDIDEEEIKASFRRFGSLVVDWPHKAESKSYFPPKGYAFLLFQEEASVQALIEASLQEDDKLYLCVSSPTIKDKPVQIRPWRLSDADFVLDSTLALDPRKTVFVGGVPRPLKASELANIMNNLYGSVCYAGIDTDPELKYPKGAGRVAFSNHQSYIDAISARFVHLRHCEIEKRVEVKPYVLDDQVCDECRGSRCGNKFAPFFCANITCLQYYCENCWTTVHSQLGKEFHKPLVKEGADRPRGSQFKWC